MQEDNRSPAWIALGLGIGIAVGVAVGNVGVGIALGAAVGLSMYTIQNRRNGS